MSLHFDISDRAIFNFKISLVHFDVRCFELILIFIVLPIRIFQYLKIIFKINFHLQKLHEMHLTVETAAMTCSLSNSRSARCPHEY